MADHGEHDDDRPDNETRPSPGASDPGEPGYDGAVTVGDDGFEGLPEPTPDESGERHHDDAVASTDPGEESPA